MEASRIHVLRQGNNKGTHVIYVMQGALRTKDNHALNYAITYANKNNLTLVVIFNMLTLEPEATRRGYQFMTEGLLDVYESYKRLNISFYIESKTPEDLIKPYIHQAHAVCFDQAYLKHNKMIINRMLSVILDQTYVFEIDTNVLVPVRIASNKVEYGAYTIRPKIHKLKDIYFDLTHDPLYEGEYEGCSVSFDLKYPEQYLSTLDINQDILPSHYFIGGQSEAFNRLNHFIHHKINAYIERNEPHLQITSTLSPYIHYGMISTQRMMLIVLEGVTEGKVTQEAYDAFFEQLIVRRELAFNYVFYLNHYTSFESITEPWAYITMEEHKDDPKPFIYSLEQLIEAKTHDIYWNAAMQEMIKTGYMHNYMRMYWAKKIIEWSHTFKEAYEHTIYLNNLYFIDGRDPISYGSVAWNYGKHDRAWNERPIFGKLRYMNAQGLERKFDMKAYIRFVNDL
jgi:deoxyribodipyrimidine photo-lyase